MRQTPWTASYTRYHLEMTKVYESGSKKKKKKDTSDHRYHQLLPLSSFFEKLTDHNNQYKTIEESIIIQSAINTHFLSYQS